MVKSKLGVLLLHGWTGTRTMMRPISRAPAFHELAHTPARPARL